MYKRPEKPPFASDESYEFVYSIEASVRTENILMKLDVKSLEELCALTREKVMATRNAGKRTWLEITELQAHFSWAPIGDIQQQAEMTAIRLNGFMNELSARSDAYFLILDSLNCVAVCKRLNP